ncbi:MAG: hypothetical protein V7776_23215 [Halopseudomonas aestusnigri]
MKYLILDAKKHWECLEKKYGLPLREKLDPIEVPKLLGNSCLIQVLNGGLDFKYLIIGSGIQAISRLGQTGKKVSELESQKKPSKIFNLFTLVVETKLPQYSQLEYIGKDKRVKYVDIGVFPFATHSIPRTVSFLWSITQATSF